MAVSEAYGRISRGFWSDPDIKRKLSAEQKALLLYYFTSPHSNMSGLYSAPFEFTAALTGLSVATVREWTLGCLAPFVSYDEETEEVFVHRMTRHQVGETIDPKDKRIAALKRLLASAHSRELVRHFGELHPALDIPVPEAPSKEHAKPLRSHSSSSSSDRAVTETEQKQNPPGGAARAALPAERVVVESVEVHSAPLGNGNALAPPSVGARRRMTGAEVLTAWIGRQPAPPSPSECSKQGSAAKEIAAEHSAAEIAAAFVGIGQVWPHAPPKNEPWDLFDLKKRFPKALAAAANHPEVRRRREDAEFEEALSEAGYR